MLLTAIVYVPLVPTVKLPECDLTGMRSAAAGAGGGSAGAVLHPPMTLLPASVTEPSDVVSVRPATAAPDPTVTADCATTLPVKLTPLSVAALVTCQNTWHGSTPINVTREPTFATSELDTLKM